MTEAPDFRSIMGDSNTYLVLKGLITKDEYHRRIEAERARYGLPPMPKPRKEEAA